MRVLWYHLNPQIDLVHVEADLKRLPVILVQTELVIVKPCFCRCFDYGNFELQYPLAYALGLVRSKAFDGCRIRESIVLPSEFRGTGVNIHNAEACLDSIPCLVRILGSHSYLHRIRVASIDHVRKASDDEWAGEIIDLTNAIMGPHSNIWIDCHVCGLKHSVRNRMPVDKYQIRSPSFLASWMLLVD